MLYIKTENVDKLSVPFGIIIGPCTVLSNIVKLVRDVAKLTFNGLLSIHYKSSQAYTNFKLADLAWKKNVSSQYKPKVSSDGYIQVNIHSFADPEYIKTIKNAAGTPIFFNWSTTYQALSEQDKRQFAFEQAKQDSIQHLTFIAIGLIRSIPIIGGIARCVYNAKAI